MSIPEINYLPPICSMTILLPIESGIAFTAASPAKTEAFDITGAATCATPDATPDAAVKIGDATLVVTPATIDAVFNATEPMAVVATVAMLEANFRPVVNNPAKSIPTQSYYHILSKKSIYTVDF